MRHVRKDFKNIFINYIYLIKNIEIHHYLARLA